jgi:hypothetical protein
MPEKKKNFLESYFLVYFYFVLLESLASKKCSSVAGVLDEPYSQLGWTGTVSIVCSLGAGGPVWLLR